MEEPKQIKHYELLDRLGAGGMGVVYRARDTRLGRTVAIKLLPGELGQNEERRRRFEREARIVSGMSHPGIATLYDFDHDGENAFLVMELVRGSNLRDLLRDGPLPIERLLECAAQVADALSAAHRLGVVHRDLKPENIMAADSGHYKVLDFGVARVQQTASEGEPIDSLTPTRTLATRAGALLGTVAYMSPEQVLSRPVDARSDVFSFGSLIYELATGRPAFRGDSEIATAHAIAYEKPQPLRQLRPDAPSGLGRIVERCLAKSPEERYQTADDVTRDLRTLQVSTLTGSRRGRLLADDLRSPGRGLGRWVWLALGALVIVVALAIGFRDQRRGTESTALSEPQVTALEATRTSSPDSGPPRVIVAFFENNTGAADADWVSRGLPEMLTTDLSGADNLEVIATQRLHDLLAMSGEGGVRTLDRSSTAELARWAGADVVISGSVFKLDDRYRIDAQAYDTSTGKVVAAHKVEGADLFSLVGQLTSGLLTGLDVSRPKPPDVQQVAAVPESAYRTFIEGRSLYDNLRYDDAEEVLRQAVEEAPDFAAARLQLAKSLLARGETERAAEELLALDAEVTLSEPDRLLTGALASWFARGDLEGGVAQAEELTRRFPNHRDVHVWWGRALGRLDGDSLGATRQLRRALAQDPNDLAAISELADQLARLGELDTAVALLEGAAAQNPVAGEQIRSRIEGYKR